MTSSRDDQTAPAGWKVARIGDLFDSWGGLTPSKANGGYWGKGVPWVSSRDVKASRLGTTTHSVTQKAIDETRLRVCPPGSVLVVVRSGILAHRLPVTVTESPVTINQDVKAFHSKEPLLNEWLALFLRMSAADLLASSRRDGTTVQSIQYPLLKNAHIPVPPLDERRAIIRVVDEALDKTAPVSHRLIAARRAVERLRDGVLSAACSGRLTAEWRTRQSDSRGAASLVSEAIQLRAQSIKKPPVTAADADAKDVPDGWQLVSFDAITTRITSGSRDWSRYYGDGAGTFVMAQNVRPGVLDWSYRQAVDPPPDDPSRERSQILKGDLLITIVGANTGDVAPVLEDRPEHFVCQSVALARPAITETTGFLNLWFNSAEHGQRYFADCIYGAGRPHLSFDQLRAAPVFLPPLAEQREVVRQAEALLETADGLISRIDAAGRLVDLSSKAVLAKAFRGELLTSTEGLDV